MSITMRSPQSWGYFGITSAALVAEHHIPGWRAECLVTTCSRITLEPCLEAIAAGDGINREIEQFDEEHRSIVLCAIAGLFLHMPSYAS